MGLCLYQWEFPLGEILPYSLLNEGGKLVLSPS